MLFDCVYLVIYQCMMCCIFLIGFDGFLLDRIVELYVVGGIMVDTNGFIWVDDNYIVVVLVDIWEVFYVVVFCCFNFKVVVFECECNFLNSMFFGFECII